MSSAFEFAQAPVPASADLLQELLSMERRIFGKAGGWELPELQKELAKRTGVTIIARMQHQPQPSAEGEVDWAQEAALHAAHSKQQAHSNNKAAAKGVLGGAGGSSTSTSTSSAGVGRGGARSSGKAAAFPAGSQPGSSTGSSNSSSAGMGSSSSTKAAQPESPIVGYIMCSTTSLNVHVVKVAVRPESRRMGVGRALMQAALKAAVATRRVTSASLYVAVENTAAITLYKSMGFQEESVMADYYRPGHHASKMVIEDLPGALAAFP